MATEQESKGKVDDGQKEQQKDVADKSGKYSKMCLKRPLSKKTTNWLGAQWLSSRVLDSRQRGRRFEPQRRHWVVVFEQDTFILA